MVVNRKQPTIPTAPLSRSSSSQPIPTKRHKFKPTVPTNGAESDQAPAIQTTSSNQPSKLKPMKTRRPRTLVDRLFLFSLFIFASYSFLLCRTNSYISRSHGPEPLLCHSLALYRTRILEPYVLPPITHTLSISHKLTKPYIDSGIVHAEPYIAPVRDSLKSAQPYVAQAQRTVATIWNDRLVPLYQHTLRPWWKSAVVPRWEQYLKPHLIPLQRKAASYWKYYISNPVKAQYTLVWLQIHTLYAKHGQPLVLKVAPYITKFASKVHTSSNKAINTYSERVHPRLVSSWRATRPYLCIAWKQGRRIASQTLEVVTTQGRWILKQLGGHRRTYVDPHVRRIWEKVTEKNTSNGVITSRPIDTDATTAPIPEPTGYATPEPIPVPTTETPASEDTKIDNPSIPTPEESAGDQTVYQFQETSAPVPHHRREVEEVAAAISVAENIDAASSSSVVPTPTPDGTDPPVPQVEQEVLSIPAEDTVVGEQEPITPTSFGSVSGVGATEIPPKKIEVEPVVEEDLDDFLKDLGVDDGVESPSSFTSSEPSVAVEEPSPYQATPATETEEERAVHRAVVAQKRLDITARHENWQVKLDEAYHEEGVKLAMSLAQSRDAAVNQLDTIGWGKSGEDNKRGDADGILGDVQSEGQRLLRGLEAYLKKAEGRTTSWKFAEGDDQEKVIKKNKSKDEKDKWENVISKVQSKFDEKVQSVRAQVHQWYTGIKGAEINEAIQSSLVLKAIADQAQADIGLDYAWLDDVTYEDWQRYHDLMRTYEKYERHSAAIQNGTSTSPPAPIDPITPALDALDGDLQDIILGFQVALSALKSRGFSLFSVYTGEAEEEDGFFVVQDGQVRKDDLRGVDLGSLGVGSGTIKKGNKEEEVRILPIHDEEPPKDVKWNDPAFVASQIMIGKSAEQVEEALKDAPPVEDARSRHEEL